MTSGVVTNERRWPEVLVVLFNRVRLLRHAVHPPSSAASFCATSVVTIAIQVIRNSIKAHHSLFCFRFPVAQVLRGVMLPWWNRIKYHRAAHNCHIWLEIISTSFRAHSAWGRNVIICGKERLKTFNHGLIAFTFWNFMAVQHLQFK